MAIAVCGWWRLRRRGTQPIPASQLLSGDSREARPPAFDEGGWAVISQAIADEHHLHIGQSFVLPSPRPMTLRVAALSTNVGWPPGAIILNADDYARAWGSSEVSAYNVTVGSGVAPRSGAPRDRAGAGSARRGSPWRPPAAAKQRQRATSRQGLSRLTQIATLVLIAAMLATAAAMGAMIWQRRPRLGRHEGRRLRQGRAVARRCCVESALLLGAGCSIGAVFGIYGQLLLSHALASVTGFPVVFSIGALVAIGSLALVTAVAVVIIALPGYLAVRVRPALSLQD